MKVLFVCSGNSKEGIGPIVKAQGDSLQKAGVELDYFTIKGKGATGYIRNIFSLARYIRKNKFDVVHAHYSFSGFCATMAGSPNLVVSLMGSDVHQSAVMAFVIRLCSGLFWKATIVKSPEMRDKLKLKNVSVFPNGVDLDKFSIVEKTEAQQLVKFDSTRRNIIFVSNPSRPEKNYKLAQEAVQLLDDASINLFAVYNVPHKEIVNYMYAADVLILTSLWEGSPNVIKEALACNCPLVTVPVGDVRHLVEGVSGCYICSYEPEDVAYKLKQALSVGIRTEGRKRIVELGLDSKIVAKNIVDIYSSLLK